MKTLIVGATSGIARSVASLLSARGEDLILAGRDDVELQRTSRDLAIRFHSNVAVIHYEAGAEIDRDLLHQCQRVIVAIGYLGSETKARVDPKHAHDITFGTFEGLVRLLNAAASVFQQRGSGSIAVLSSVAGDRVRRSNATYGAAKAALNRHVEALARDNPRVQFTTLKLGPVDTEMTYGLRVAMAISADEAAHGIVDALDTGVAIAYIPRRWQPIMSIIRRLPQGVVDKLA